MSTPEKVTNTQTPKQSTKKQNPKEKQKIPDLKRSSVISLSNIPHGFYEKQIFLYFRQFGEVKSVKCFKYSKKSEKSKALVKFKDRKVAKIAAESINGTNILGKKIRSELVKNRVIISRLKKGAFTKSQLKSDDHEVLDDPTIYFREKVLRINRKKSPEEHKKEVEAFERETKKNLAKLKNLGIDCDFVTIC